MKPKDIRRMVEEEEGGTVVKLVCSKHWKARIRRPDGTEFLEIFPSSESDYRALLNKRSQLRKSLSGSPKV